MRAVVALLCLLCLSAPADAATATMRAPSFTFNGTYTLTFDTPVRATVRLDTGQVAAGTGTQITFQVPDGVHSFTVNVTNQDGTMQVLSGAFTSQDLTPMIARQVQAAVEASHAGQVAAREARDAALLARDESVEVLNATFAVQETVQHAKVAIEALLPELQRQGEVQRVAAAHLEQSQEALAEQLQVALENQTHAMHEAEKSVKGLQHTLEALLVLVAVGIACLAVYLHSLRRRAIEDGALLRSLRALQPGETTPPTLPPSPASRRRPPRPAPAPLPPTEPPNLDVLLGLPSEGGGRDERA